MKTKNKLIITAMALVAIIAISLAVIGCEEEPEPQPHESTINAFDRDIIVKGDASISKNDFDAAKEKLQTAMSDLSENVTGTSPRACYTNMLSRDGFKIIIGTGDASPAADANKSMTIGIEYLRGNNALPTIATAINALVVTGNAFAD
jgi:hypothetical protein